MVINVVSWSKAYALFPNSTFICRDGLVLKRPNEYFKNQLQKYKQRGWTVEESPPVEDKELRHEFARTRRVGDRFSFIMPFDTNGIALPRVPDAVLEYASFDILRDSPLRPHQISARTYSACMLEYEYTGTSTFHSSICSVMDERTLEEIRKLPEASRPPYFSETIEVRNNLSSYRDQLQQDGIQLKKHDDKMPEWYAEWERRQAASIQRRSNTSP